MSEPQVLSMEQVDELEKELPMYHWYYAKHAKSLIATVRHYQKSAEMSAGAHIERVKYSEWLEDAYNEAVAVIEHIARSESAEDLEFRALEFRCKARDFLAKHKEATE